MLGNIQSLPFLLVFDAQTQGPVDDLEDDEADDNEQLSGIPFQRTRCTAYGMELSNKCASMANNGEAYGLWIATRRLERGVHQNGAAGMPHHGNDRGCC